MATLSANAAANINGVVYRDYDYNGSRGSADPGVEGVTVSAYDSENVLQGTATTNSNGGYTLDAGGAGPYRVEFTNIPSFLRPGIHGTGSGTTVQFVPDGEVGGVDLALHNPADHCQPNPDLALSCFENGANIGSQGKGVISFPYDATGSVNDATSDYAPPTGNATIGEVGTVWGSAYQRTTERMYLASFLKRHSGLVDSPSTVYVLDYGAGGGLDATFDLQGITPANGGASIDLGSVCRRSATDGNPDINCGNAADNALPSNNTVPSIDLDAFGKVGAISYGDIEIDEGGNTLWLVNLNQRALISVDVSDPTALPGTTNQYSIAGLPGAPTCTDGEYRPWGLAFHDGLGYLGGVCDAASGVAANLDALVHTFDPANVPAGLTEIVSFGLDYNRESAWPNQVVDSTAQHWNPWTSTWPTNVPTWSTGSLLRGLYPQPIVSDIDFAVDGSMILGLMDRWGNQTGPRNYTAESGSTTPFGMASAGDIIHLCNNNGTFVLEGTTSGGFTCATNEDASQQPSGITPDGDFEANDGPSGQGEYYPNDHRKSVHSEISLGALASLKRDGTVASVVFDPWTDFDTNGIHWYNTGSGITENAYEIVPFQEFPDIGSGTVPSVFGKAAGLGDLQLICDPAPIEIGNRVWLDTNNNGIQDPGEAPIEGVVVALYDASGNNELIRTTTDDKGEYYFNQSNLIGGLGFNTTYQVRIDLSQPGQATNALEGYAPTITEAASTIGDGNDDIRDSNGDASIEAGFAIATITTGNAGENDHTIDFGFASYASIGNFVWFDANENGTQEATEPGINNVSVELFDANDVSQGTTATENNGFYEFKNLVPGDYYVVFTLPNGTTWTQNSAGTSDAVDSDAVPNADPATAQTEATTLDGGEDDLTWDAGVIVEAEIALEKQVQDPNDAAVWLDADATPVSYLNGTQAQYRFIITNTGSTALTSVVLDDPTAGVVGCPANLAVDLASVGGVLDPAESVMVEPAACLSPVLTGAEFTNLANVSAIPSLPDGTPVEDALGLPADTIAPVTAEDPANITTISVASIGDTVWFDTNKNGLQDGNEPGIDGVGVQLFDSADNSVGSAATINGGFYQFTELAPGEYYVVFTLPDGTTWTQPSIGTDDAVDSDAIADANPLTARTFPTDLTATEDDPTWDAGVFIAASIMLDKQVQDPNDAAVWHDADTSAITFPVDAQAKYRFIITNNGSSSLTNVVLNDPTPGTSNCPADLVVDLSSVGNVLDPNEEVIVEPADCLSPVLGADGFTNMADVSGLPSLIDGTPTEEALGLPAGTIERVVDEDPASVGTQPQATLGDKVWFDTNRDGVQGVDEPGVSGVTVELLDSAGNVVETDVTNSLGNYLFLGLAPDNYAVRFTLPNGTAWTSSNVGDSDAADSDVDPTTGETIQTALAPFEVDQNWDAGIVVNPSIELQKQVEDPASLGSWLDADSDAVDYPLGSQGKYRFIITNSGSTPLISVVLDDPTPGVTGCPTQLSVDLNDASLSNGDGVLMPGESITIEPTACLSPALDATGFTNEANVIAVASQEDGNSLENALGLLPGTIPNVTDSNPAFIGRIELASIGDKVWLDTNANGIQEEDEGGLLGVTVDLYDSTNTNVDTTMTDINGMYLFDALAPGDYSLIFTAPAGYSISPQNAGSDDAADSDADPATGSTGAPTTLDPGENDLTWDAGLYLEASIGDTVWLDANSNGLQDANEPGVVGVTVMLFQPGNDAPIATVVTDDSGKYAFTGLLPGDYYIEVTPPETATITTMDAGDNDQLDSDIDPTTGQTIVTTLGPGENDPSWDAGLIQESTVASLGSYVWLDVNANGVQEADENGIAGVTVVLFDVNGTLIDTTTTDNNGEYLFTELAPGNYYVQFSRPNETQYFFSPQGMATVGTDSNPDTTTGRTVVTELLGGENDLTWDAGVYAPPLLSINKAVSQTSIQPGDPINYTMTYENAGLSTAKNVVITEVIPEHTTWDKNSSSNGWTCQDNRVIANTICTYPIGDVPPETKGNITLSFVVEANQFLPENVSIIQNEAFISDDSQNGSVLVGQSSGVVTVPIIRPTALDTNGEPNDAGANVTEISNFIYVPFMR